MIFATNNSGKIREIKDILDMDIKSLKEANLNIEIEEDQESFYGNAYKKAREIYEITKEEVIADDSGLCITALDGFPGVLTHRFLGENATDEERNLALIKKLEGIEDRSAEVVCNLVYYDGTRALVGEGIIKGKIVLSPRGENGFGFDSIFELDNGKTLAQLTLEEKNKVSARFLAALDLKKKMKKRNPKVLKKV